MNSINTTTTGGHTIGIRIHEKHVFPNVLHIIVGSDYYVPPRQPLALLRGSDAEIARFNRHFQVFSLCFPFDNSQHEASSLIAHKHCLEEEENQAKLIRSTIIIFPLSEVPQVMESPPRCANAHRADLPHTNGINRIARTLFTQGNNQKRVYPVRLESKPGTAWNQVKNTLDEPRDWPKTDRTRFSEIMTRVHL